MYTIKKSRNILKNKYTNVKGYSQYNKLQLNNLILKCSDEAYENRKNMKYYTIYQTTNLINNKETSERKCKIVESQQQLDE